jgi:DNA-binding MarR family transcriptional regulator
VAESSAIGDRLPLPTLVSQTLVAFGIEFDNEWEHLLAHRTSTRRSQESPPAPWLVSMVMWSNCLQFVGDDGVTVAELEHLARTGTNLPGMQRWGYITIEPDPSGNRSKRPRRDALIRLTRGGERARDVLGPLFGAIEKRWEERFGVDALDELRESLRTVARHAEPGLPDCLPILGYGLWSTDIRAGAEAADVSTLGLPALLSRVLLAFAVEFERDSGVSLAIGANVLRVLDERGVRVRDVPLLSGVSKEAISMAAGILERHRLAVVEPDPNGSRFNVVRLTSKGRAAQEAYRQRIGDVEERWRTDDGNAALESLRCSLDRLVGDATPERSPLFRGITPYPDGWRASVGAPRTLPHYPMVLHRGGFPDGS